MLENSAEVMHRQRAGRSPTKARSRFEKRRYSGNSSVARRVRVLVSEFKAASSATPAALQKAAELVVVAENLRARALRGEGDVDLNELVKVQGIADRACRALGLDRKREPPRVPLRERLAAEFSGD